VLSAPPLLEITQLCFGVIFSTVRVPIAGGILSIPSECATNVEIRIEALAFLGFEGGNPGQELR